MERNHALLLLAALTFGGCSHLKRTPSSTVEPPASGLYVNGDPQAQPAMQLVQSAKTSIDIEIYEMEDVAFLDAVRAKAHDGVRVRIIKDPYPVPKKDQCLWFPGLKDRDKWGANPGTGTENNDEAMPSCAANALPMIAEIEAKGGAVIPFYKPHLCGQDEHPENNVNFCFEHGKIIVVDGKIALVSTGNYNPDNFCDEAKVCNRDYSVVTDKSDEVGLLDKIFENDLKETRYPLHPLVDPATSPAPSVTASPYSLAPLQAFLKAHGTGPGHLIQIENQYLKDKDLNDAIQDAARSGAKVQVMVGSLCSFNRPDSHPEDKPAAQALNDGFTTAGAEIKYFPSTLQVWGHEGYLHAKAIVIDRKFAWVGSVNGSSSALNTNREFGLFIEDTVSVTKLADQIGKDFAEPAAESFEETWTCAKDRIGHHEAP